MQSLRLQVMWAIVINGLDKMAIDVLLILLPLLANVIVMADENVLLGGCSFLMAFEMDVA